MSKRKGKSRGTASARPKKPPPSEVEFRRAARDTLNQFWGDDRDEFWGPPDEEFWTTPEKTESAASKIRDWCQLNPKARLALVKRLRAELRLSTSEASRDLELRLLAVVARCIAERQQASRRLPSGPQEIRSRIDTLIANDILGPGHGQDKDTDSRRKRHPTHSLDHVSGDDKDTLIERLAAKSDGPGEVAERQELEMLVREVLDEFMARGRTAEAVLEYLGASTGEGGTREDVAARYPGVTPRMMEGEQARLRARLERAGMGETKAG